MQRHRVLVLYSQSLLAQGLQRMLERAGDFEVVGVDIDAQDAVGSLRAIQPDAVVIDVDDLRGRDINLIVHLLREVPSVQVVCLAATDGDVRLYRRDMGPVTRSDELLDALRGGPSAATGGPRAAAQ